MFIDGFLRIWEVIFTLSIDWFTAGIIVGLLSITLIVSSIIFIVAYGLQNFYFHLINRWEKCFYESERMD